MCLNNWISGVASCYAHSFKKILGTPLMDLLQYRDRKDFNTFFMLTRKPLKLVLAFRRSGCFQSLSWISAALFILFAKWEINLSGLGADLPWLVCKPAISGVLIKPENVASWKCVLDSKRLVCPPMYALCDKRLNPVAMVLAMMSLINADFVDSVDLFRHLIPRSGVKFPCRKWFKSLPGPYLVCGPGNRVGSG